MPSTFHTSVNIRGYLRDASNFQLRSMFRREGGDWMTAAEAKDVLLEYLVQGHEYLPIGEACEGFDPKRGCPGHAELA